MAYCQRTIVYDPFCGLFYIFSTVLSTRSSYDVKDPLSIERFAKGLLNKSLSQIFGDKAVQLRKGKGKLGQLLEELYFGYKPNSESRADFEEAGVELKTAPLKQTKKGFRSKERLVFNIIDYNEEYKYNFDESSFWKKNALILLMFYLFEKGKLDIDYIFKIIQLWKFPETDLKIIKDDWKKIVQKIKDGKAHELSEGDTLYLAASTKGANASSLRKQPFSNEMAMQRAFSLKSSYINFIIQESLYGKSKARDEALQVEAVVKNTSAYKKGETFEDLVIKKFKPYYGYSEAQLIKTLGLKTNPKAKNRYEVFARAILGVREKNVEEFEKADVIMKTVRLQSTGTLKESMSFKQIQFKEIIHETWLESSWFDELERRFFFVVFKADKNGEQRLEKVKFFSIPALDMEELEKVWTDTRNKIKAKHFDDFIKISDKRIGHVRPKGADEKDRMETADGSKQKKKCFWLNSSYIKEIVR
ncbi:MAG TPA: Sau3AI family type II restriction endonuclease [Chitinophagaceae bacterium]|nr:Sau3AI family type II restriction endonuclease [Chitinophagaceae bacterium]